MYIVEFVGLPGSGKTTMCKRYEWNLKKRQKIATNVQVQALIFSGIKRRLFLLRVFLYPKSIKIMSLARKHVPNYKSSEAKAWLKRIQQILFLLDQYERQKLEYALMDEGFVQFVTSICHGEEISDSMMKFAQKVFEMAYKGRECKFLYVDVDKNEAMERIKKRNRPGDRFLADSDAEVLEKLRVKEGNLLKCLDLLKEYDVRTIKPTGEEKIQELLSMIE